MVKLVNAPVENKTDFGFKSLNCNPKFRPELDIVGSSPTPPTIRKSSGFTLKTWITCRMLVKKDAPCTVGKTIN